MIKNIRYLKNTEHMYCERNVHLKEVPQIEAFYVQICVVVVVVVVVVVPQTMPNVVNT